MNASSKNEIAWNDRMSTGALRVVMYFAFTCVFVRDYLHQRTLGRTTGWDIAFAGITTLFMVTSAVWAVRKQLERREQSCLSR